LNKASILSFANPGVAIDSGAFQSSGNAVLYLPAATAQTGAGGKTVVTAGTEAIQVALTNADAASFAGGAYLNVKDSGKLLLTEDKIAAIAKSASGEAADISYSNKELIFSGSAYKAVEQVVEIYKDFAGEIRADELNKTFRALTEDEAEALNQKIAEDSSYSKIKTLLSFQKGYYMNGNAVELDANWKAYDVKTGEVIEANAETGMPASTGSGYYKYVTYRDTDNLRRRGYDLLFAVPYYVFLQFGQHCKQQP
jgi:hypothetical protein